MVARSTAPKPKRIAYDDVAFRWSDYDTPLWARPNSSSLRWNRARSSPTQYLSLTTDGSWAELIRAEELRTVDELRLVSMPMWVLRLRETSIADYSTFEKAEAAGFPADALVDDDYSRCQVEAERLQGAGFRGVLAPSAALPGAVNFTLFGSRLSVEWDFPEGALLASFVPSKQLAVGRPPDELLGHVRHRGDAHSGLIEFSARRPPEQR